MTLELNREIRRLSKAVFRRSAIRRSVFIGLVLTTAAGLAHFFYSFAEPLSRLSYDLPFIWRATLDTHEVVLVYLDEDSARRLNQPLDDMWNRTLHRRLLERLTRDGARLVFYDIVFDAPARDAAEDEGFAEALRGQGRVILGAALETARPTGGVKQERILPPVKILRKAAAGWGLLAFRPIDADYGVRRMFLGTSDIPSATWRAAEILEGKAVQGPRESVEPRWINYYGPPNSFSAVNFAQALAEEGVPRGYFSNKIVFIGGRTAVGYLGQGRDEFATPYSRANHLFSTGLEVHATILLNLLRDDWLRREDYGWELFFIFAIGLLAGGLAMFRPIPAALLALSASVTITFLAWWFVWHDRTWFNWAIAALIQMPLGLVWSVVSQYLLESWRRKKLRSAFSFYLSPHMADKIANSDFDLKPGGKLVEATIMFTDLEGFTTLSENLSPVEVSQTLIAYFEQTTQCILRYKGTIVDYFGDAVMAGWGAPVDDPEHAFHAAEAACDLRRLTELEINGRRLRTRVGLNSGKVLAGNLGSTLRFNYTMIGDTTNFASRLESLNKYLGTQILISEAVKSQLGGKFVTRPLGEFRLAGKTQSVVIHELICRAEEEQGEAVWIEVFEQALDSFRGAEFEQARLLMQRAMKARGGADGPAEFYLRKIDTVETSEQLENWTGVVSFTEK